MDDTPKLGLPYIAPAQAQKHVTHNEAIRNLDALTQLSVIDRDLTSPPGSPANGDRYIPASGATGDWAGWDSNIAAFQDGAWMNYIPANGWSCWIEDEGKVLLWNGSEWADVSSSATDFVSLSDTPENFSSAADKFLAVNSAGDAVEFVDAPSGASVNPTGLVGINTTADAINRLSVSSPNSLFSHDGADHRIKINKATSSDTASFLYQNNFSGRAEIGLMGDDDFHFKVSPDGSTFYDGIIIDKDTGTVDFPNGTTLSLGGGGTSMWNWIINGDFTINQRGGAKILSAGYYGYDRWKGHASGLEQIVEALEAGEYTLTWSDGGDGTFGGTTAVSPIKTTISAGDTSVVVPSSATRVSLVLGDATGGSDPFIPRHISQELALCQRYYWKGGSYFVDGYTSVSAGYITNYISIPAMMRSAATISYSATGYGNLYSASASMSADRSNIKLLTRSAAVGRVYMTFANVKANAEL